MTIVQPLCCHFSLKCTTRKKFENKQNIKNSNKKQANKTIKINNLLLLLDFPFTLDTRVQWINSHWTIEFRQEKRYFVTRSNDKQFFTRFCYGFFTCSLCMKENRPKVMNIQLNEMGYLCENS